MGQSSHNTDQAHRMGEKKPTEHRNTRGLRTERPLGRKDKGLVMRCACCGQYWPWTEAGLLFGGNPEMRGDSTDTNVTDRALLSLNWWTAADATAQGTLLHSLSHSVFLMKSLPTTQGPGSGSAPLETSLASSNFLSHLIP